MSLPEALDIWEAEGGALPATNRVIEGRRGGFRAAGQPPTRPFHEGDPVYSKVNAPNSPQGSTVAAQHVQARCRK